MEEGKDTKLIKIDDEDDDGENRQIIEKENALANYTTPNCFLSMYVWKWEFWASDPINVLNHGKFHCFRWADCFHCFPSIHSWLANSQLISSKSKYSDDLSILTLIKFETCTHRATFIERASTFLIIKNILI